MAFGGAINESTPLLSSGESFEEEIWRSGFYSHKRVRHSSERNAIADYSISYVNPNEDCFNADVESLNFDSEWKIELELRNSFSNRYRRRRERKVSVSGYSKVVIGRMKRLFTDSTEVLRLLVCTLIAIATACIYILLSYITDLIIVNKHRLFVMFTKDSMRHLWLKGLVLPGWVILNVLIATFGSIFVYLLEPRICGSGVPELRAFINGIAVPRAVHFRSLLARFIGMVITPIAELPLGRSEPLMYVGGAVAAGLSQGRASTFSLDCNIFKKFRNHAEKRDFITAGAAAGFCAAFGTPLSAVLFMMEEMSTHWNQAGVWRVMWSSIVTSVSVAFVATFWHPLEATIGSTMFGRIPEINMPLTECVVAFFIGIVGGVVGVLFRLLNRAINRTRARHTARRFRIVEVMVLSIFSVCCYLPLLWLEGNKHCRTLHRGNMVTPVGTACPDGQTNSLGMLVLQLPSKAFQALVHEPAETFYPLSTFLFAAYWFVGCALFYGCNLPGGVIMPNFIIGAAWGRLLGLAFGSMTSSSILCIEKFALFGAASQTAAVLGVFLTIPMMFVEATQSIEVGVVVAVAVLTAKVTAALISSPDFYTTWTRLLQFVYLSAEPDEHAQHLIALRRLRASDVMSSPVTFVRTTETVECLLNILKETPHNGFPVVSSRETDDGTCGKLRGFIDRTTLVALLEHKELYSKDLRTRPVVLDTDTFRRTRAPSLDTVDQSILEDEMSRRIVVADYMSIAPHVVQSHMSFLRTYNMFRTLGLRHLPVVTDHNNVAGIITRKDLLRFRWKSYFSKCQTDLVSGELIECSFVKTENEEAEE